jgi:iron complex outermembrane receptor protein
VAALERSLDHRNFVFGIQLGAGGRAGFRRTNGFSVFIDCRNLTDQRYASSIDVIADARTEQNPEIFHPGDGRSFYGGVSWSW